MLVFVCTLKLSYSSNGFAVVVKKCCDYLGEMVGTLGAACADQ